MEEQKQLEQRKLEIREESKAIIEMYIDASGVSWDTLKSFIRENASEIFMQIDHGETLVIEFDDPNVMEEATKYIINRLGEVVYEIENVDKSYWDEDKLYIVVYETRSSRYIYTVSTRWVSNPGVGFLQVSLFSHVYTTPA